MIFTLERELLPSYRFAWNAHPRLSFALDDAHPSAGSHHQKIVVVDDTLAFAGGLDLTIRRWDTPAHDARDPARVDPDGAPYPPMHDVQMMVDGDAAAALGELARERWHAPPARRCRAQRARRGADPWPPAVAPDVRDAPIGIARTMPALDGDARGAASRGADARARSRRPAAPSTSRTSTSPRRRSARRWRAAWRSPTDPRWCWSCRARSTAGWSRARWGSCARACCAPAAPGRSPRPPATSASGGAGPRTRAASTCTPRC